MKLRLGDTLIETDHIEQAVINSENTVAITFISGKSITVVCGGRSTPSRAWWDMGPEALLNHLEQQDYLMLREDTRT